MAKKSEAIRKMILQNFRQLVKEEGYSHTTMRQLSERCGMSQGHINFYFKKKKDLIIALKQPFLLAIEQLAADYMPSSKKDPISGLFNYMLMEHFIICRIENFTQLIKDLYCDADVLEEAAYLLYTKAKKALSDGHIAYDAYTLSLSCACAAHISYDLVYLMGQNQENIDYTFIFTTYAKTLFMHIDLPDLNRHIQNTLDELKQLDSEAILNAYDTTAFTFIDPDSPS